jgi:peroxiredoxin
MQNFKVFILIIALLTGSCYALNDGLNVGDAMPNPVFSFVNDYDNSRTSVSLFDYKQDMIMLVAFMPDMSLSNPSAKVITTGLDAYFADGLSFRSFEGYQYENPPLKILVVTADPEIIAREQIAKLSLNFDVVSDENMNIANYFGINKWQSPGDASHIYIVDKDNKIIYARYDYKGEGEKLKDIQTKLYSLFGINQKLPDGEYPLLVQGDKAPDFEFEYVNDIVTEIGTLTESSAKLSDYLGTKNVLIAFYPAPYSLSCSSEVTRFDTYAEERMIEKINSRQLDDLELLMVSVSNNYILEKWKTDMNLKNIKLVSDNSGDISMKYNSFNSLGWNKRTVFLINKEGIVQYIDWDYNVDNDDFGILKEQIIAVNP